MRSENDVSMTLSPSDQFGLFRYTSSFIKHLRLKNW